MLIVIFVETKCSLNIHQIQFNPYEQEFYWKRPGFTCTVSKPPAIDIVTLDHPLNTLAHDLATPLELLIQHNKVPGIFQ